MNEIIEIRHCRAWTYHIRFDDGTEGEVDLSGYTNRGPVFAPFTDLEFFRHARLEGGTIVWPNGADIAPETLYELVSAKSSAGLA